MRLLITLFFLFVFNLYANDLNKSNTTLPTKETTYIDSMALGIGKTNRHKDIQRLSIQKDFKERIDLIDIEIEGYFDFAFNRFDFDKKDTYSLSITPIFKYDFTPINDFTPYALAGIGASFLSHTYGDDRRYSTSFQFEDRIGMGIRKDKIDFQLAYMHISNASIKEPNEGIDSILLNLIYHY